MRSNARGERATSQGDVSSRKRSGHYRALYASLSVAALGLITTVNRVGAEVLKSLDPSLSWLAATCIPSLLACFTAYWACRPARPSLPEARTDWHRLARLAGTWLSLWILVSATAALIVGH